MSPTPNVLDRVIGALAPRWQLKRDRARIASELLRREYYKAATIGRRTQGWRAGSADANAAAGASLARLRELARALERDNPWVTGGILDTIETETVGWGILPTVQHDAFKRWSESTECDADGRLNLAGLAKLVMRSVARDGEVLVRRRWRLLADGYTLPLQLQVLEADYLDTLKDQALPNGGRIVQGVEYDVLGNRVGYWVFPEHPGATRAVLARGGLAGSRRIAATEILHVFKLQRAGQVRGISWFAAALPKLEDFDRYDDATLMKQLIAACLAVFTTDVDGSSPSLGSVDSATPTVDELQPGMIANLPPGRSITTLTPPRVDDYGPYSKTQLRAIAKPFGITYEALTGDYGEVNFSSARMARIGYWAKVEDWRWRMLVPLFLNPVWSWAMEAALLAGLPTEPLTDWTAPALPMLEPDKEGLAHMRNVRAGVSTLSEVVRERGYNPGTFFAEAAADFAKLDELGLVLDSDPRKMTQAGQVQGTAAVTINTGGGSSGTQAAVVAAITKRGADADQEG